MDYTRYRVKDGERAFVVAFDVCSSSEIIEKLTLTDRVRRYVKCMSKLKHYMAENFMTKGLPFEPYKFTGDGWILLFPPETEGPALLKFMLGLAEYARVQLDAVVAELDSPPRIVGITLGADKGNLFHAKMYGAHEYVGRSIVIACRLQGAVKDVAPDAPAGKALVSPEVFAELGDMSDVVISDEKPALRNIGAGEPFPCKRIALLPN